MRALQADGEYSHTVPRGRRLIQAAIQTRSRIPERVAWLSRIFPDFDAIHTGHSRNRNEGEDDFALGGGSNPGKGSVQRSAFSARLFKDIEIPQKGHAVTIDVEHTAAKPTHASITASVVSLAEFQCHPIPALGHGHSIRKMPPSLAAVERNVPGWDCAALPSRIRSADQRISAHDVGITP